MSSSDEETPQPPRGGHESDDESSSSSSDDLAPPCEEGAEEVNALLAGDDSEERPLDVGVALRMELTPLEAREGPSRKRERDELDDFDDAQPLLEDEDALAHGYIRTRYRLRQNRTMPFNERSLRIIRLKNHVKLERAISTLLLEEARWKAKSAKIHYLIAQLNLKRRSTDTSQCQ